MKIISRFLIFLVASTVILVLGRNVIAKTAVKVGVKSVTGLNLEIGKFNLGLDSSLDIQNLVLENPKGFEEEIMVDLPKVAVALDLPAILKGNLHVKDVTLYLLEFQIIRNKEGVLNLDALKPAQKEKKTDVKKKEKAPVGEKKEGLVQIDHVHLKVDKVVFRDYSTPVTIKKDFNVNIDEEWFDVTDLDQLVRSIIGITLRNTTLGSLANIDLEAFSDAGKAALEEGKRLAADAQVQAKVALDQVKKVEMKKIQDLGASGIEGSKVMAEKAEEGLKNMAGSLKESSKGLFGSVKDSLSTASKAATTN